MPEIILTCCGAKMVCSTWKEEEDFILAGYDCPNCGSSFYGTMIEGEEKDGEQNPK